ncbi:MAG: peptidyl-prolyl cis-trans isomerase [Polyangiaceae bacterium]|nr:peptidyl-prolyl cis-trans isomerase [Polyangiaceae bacterium]MCW5790022.1 peptidyl-prolyl cis-trans isomerase [Polyangiaceae bacterium]
MRPPAPPARSRRARRWLLLALLTLAFAPPLAAQADDPVVLTVGKTTLKQSEVERRLAAVPPFQLKRYGDDPMAIKRAFLEKDLIPEVLFALDTTEADAAKSPAVRADIRAAKLQALQRSIEAELAAQQPVTDADVERYYREHERRFKTPERIKLWRILVGSEAEAKEILKTAKAAGDVKTWSNLAREKSLDKATHMRDGDLGFVLPDGRTSVPRVEVDSALFAAAAPLKNGEFVPEPVKEGQRWAVVWRRGSMAAVERTVESEAPSIRRLLERERTRKKLDGLVASLTEAHVRDRDDSLLEHVALDKIGKLGADRQPGIVPGHAPEGSPVPSSPAPGVAPR